MERIEGLGFGFTGFHLGGRGLDLLLEVGEVPRLVGEGPLVVHLIPADAIRPAEEDPAADDDAADHPEHGDQRHVPGAKTDALTQRHQLHLCPGQHEEGRGPHHEARDRREEHRLGAECRQPAEGRQHHGRVVDPEIGKRHARFAADPRRDDRDQQQEHEEHRHARQRHAHPRGPEQRQHAAQRDPTNRQRIRHQLPAPRLAIPGGSSPAADARCAAEPAARSATRRRRTPPSAAETATGIPRSVRTRTPAPSNPAT